MGTSIYSVVEIRFKGEWHRLTEVDTLEDYRLFAKMAGVRNPDNTITPISNPRGIPSDSSIVTKKRFACGDFHGHSFLTIEELAHAEKFIEQFYKLDGELYRDKNFSNRTYDRIDGPFGGFGEFCNARSILKLESIDIGEGLETAKNDIRLVFCFNC